LQELAASFAIDCVSYAVMVNHVHVILRNRPDIVATWSDEEVARRWWRLFPQRKNKDKSPCEPTADEIKLYAGKAKIYRQRLSDVSWWMRALAEPIARMSNAEDKCTGRFWEGRFKLQKLVDQAALVACSAYVDLNPVRAGVADTPEASMYTSIRDRIDSERIAAKAKVPQKIAKNRSKRKRTSAKATEQQPAYVRSDDWLAPVTINTRNPAHTTPMPSKNNKRASDRGFLLMSVEEYLTLLDWTGRQVRPDGNRGRISAKAAPILERLGVSGDVWVEVVKRFGKIFSNAAGKPDSLAQEASKRGQVRLTTHGSPLTT
jgi:REP element-mobilizing transposase RayT